MHCFMLKALTVDGDWFEFTIKDIPTPISEDEFILMNKPGSPKLRLDTIRRGDPEYHLYEGDVISVNGDKYTVCYERGFYAINDMYVYRYLSTLKDVKLISVYTESDNATIVPNFRLSHLFKYNNTVFKLNDIVGCYKGNLVIRSIQHTVNPNKVQQECRASYNGKKLYLGDKINNGIVCMYHGKIALKVNNKYIDIIDGGEM